MIGEVHAMSHRVPRSARGTRERSAVFFRRYSFAAPKIEALVLCKSAFSDL